MQRILIVEDEQKTGRYLQQGLVEEGYQADLFNNDTRWSRGRVEGTV